MLSFIRLHVTLERENVFTDPKILTRKQNEKHISNKPSYSEEEKHSEFEIIIIRGMMSEVSGP